MSWVAGTFLTVAAGAAAPPLDENEAGGEDGGLGVQIFEAGLEVAADEGGVFGDFHKALRESALSVISDM